MYYEGSVRLLSLCPLWVFNFVAFVLKGIILMNEDFFYHEGQKGKAHKVHKVERDNL